MPRFIVDIEGEGVEAVGEALRRAGIPTIGSPYAGFGSSLSLVPVLKAVPTADSPNSALRLVQPYLSGDVVVKGTPRPYENPPADGQ